MIISAFLYLHFHLRPLTMEMSLFHDAIVWAKPRTANQLHFLTCIILTWKSFEFTIFHPICFDNQTKLLKVPNCWSWKAELLLFLFVATSPFVETRGGNNWKWGSISLSVVTAFNLHNADQREEREKEVPKVSNISNCNFYDRVVLTNVTFPEKGGRALHQVVSPRSREQCQPGPPSNNTFSLIFSRKFADNLFFILLINPKSHLVLQKTKRHSTMAKHFVTNCKKPLCCILENNLTRILYQQNFPTELQVLNLWSGPRHIIVLGTRTISCLTNSHRISKESFWNPQKQTNKSTTNSYKLSAS